MREVARFSDVYQAEVAAAFLAAHGVETLVAERIAATMNPVLQTALGGVRLLAPADQARAAATLLAAAERGEFAQDTEDAAEPPTPTGRLFPIVTLLAGLLMGYGYAGRPYLGERPRLSAVQCIGLVLLAGLALGWGLLIVGSVILG